MNIEHIIVISMMVALFTYLSMQSKNRNSMNISQMYEVNRMEAILDDIRSGSSVFDYRAECKREALRKKAEEEYENTYGFYERQKKNYYAYNFALLILLIVIILTK